MLTKPSKLSKEYVLKLPALVSNLFLKSFLLFSLWNHKLGHQLHDHVSLKKKKKKKKPNVKGLLRIWDNYDFIDFPIPTTLENTQSINACMILNLLSLNLELERMKVERTKEFFSRVLD